MCIWCPVKDWCLILDVFLLHAQCSWNALQNNHDPVQEKAVTKDGQMCLSCSLLSR